MKVLAITFHHAHNFGSVLQAYALQKYVTDLGGEMGVPIDYKIIDFYTEFQEKFYGIYRKDLTFKACIKNLFAFYYRGMLHKKYNKFESFLHDYCQMTDRYKTVEELMKANLNADCFLSGSDQLWNVRSLDFSDVYYLPFIQGQKKISYAASFGPLKIDWNKYDAERYKEYLSQYAYISTREIGSADNIFQLTGKKCDIHVDPTLLLNLDDWRSIQSEVNYKRGRYILFYCLEPTKMQMKMVTLISQKLKLPILITRFNNKNDIVNPFVKMYDSGPRDFLSYVDHAALVLTSSFHGTVFSLLYHKPFYVLNGKADNRIAPILSKIGLLNRSLEVLSDVNRVTIENIDITPVNNFLDEMRMNSRAYFIKALGLDVNK